MIGTLRRSRQRRLQPGYDPEDEWKRLVPFAGIAVVALIAAWGMPLPPKHDPLPGECLEHAAGMANHECLRWYRPTDAGADRRSPLRDQATPSSP